jgi:hypothetical protein
MHDLIPQPSNRRPVFVTRRSKGTPEGVGVFLKMAKRHAENLHVEINSMGLLCAGRTQAVLSAAMAT